MPRPSCEPTYSLDCMRLESRLWAPLAQAFVGMPPEERKPRTFQGLGPSNAQIPEELLLIIIGALVDAEKPEYVCKHIQRLITATNMQFTETMWQQVVTRLHLPGQRDEDDTRNWYDIFRKWCVPEVDNQKHHPLSRVAEDWVGEIESIYNVSLTLSPEVRSAFRSLRFCLNTYGKWLDKPRLYRAIRNVNAQVLYMPLYDIVLNKVDNPPIPPSLEHAEVLGGLLQSRAYTSWLPRQNFKSFIPVLYEAPFSFSLAYLTFAWIGISVPIDPSDVVVIRDEDMWIREYGALDTQWISLNIPDQLQEFETFASLVHWYLHRFNVGGDPHQPYYVSIEPGTKERRQLHRLCMRLAVFMNKFNLSAVAQERYAPYHPLPQIVDWFVYASAAELRLPSYFVDTVDMSIVEDTPPASPASPSPASPASSASSAFDPEAIPETPPATPL